MAYSPGALVQVSAKGENVIKLMFFTLIQW